MGWLLSFFKSSIGAKVLMGVTGFLLFAWVFAHMAGNLQIYLGQDAFNSYAAMLKGTPALLWGLRVGMGALFIVHILAGMRLTRLNRAARGSAYATRTYQAAKTNGRWMVLSGLLVFAFFVFHLAHFTVGVTHPEHFSLVDSQQRHDVYSMFVLGFQQLGVTASYVIAMVLLGMHLSHGVTSMFQSLGLNGPKWTPLTSKAGPLFAGIIVAGNVSMPLAVFFGLVPLPGV